MVLATVVTYAVFLLNCARQVRQCHDFLVVGFLPHYPKFDVYVGRGPQINWPSNLEEPRNETIPCSPSKRMRHSCSVVRLLEISVDRARGAVPGRESIAQSLAFVDRGSPATRVDMRTCIHTRPHGLCSRSHRALCGRRAIILHGGDVRYTGEEGNERIRMGIQYATATRELVQWIIHALG